MLAQETSLINPPPPTSGQDPVAQAVTVPMSFTPMKPGPQPWNRGIALGYRLDSQKDKKKVTRSQMRRVVARLKKWFAQELAALEARQQQDLELVASEVVALRERVDALQRRAG